MAKLSIKVVVAGRNYPLTVEESEKDLVEKAAAEINTKIQFLKENYAVKDAQDLLAMSALQIAVKRQNASGTSTNSSANETAIQNELNDLLNDLNQ